MDVVICRRAMYDRPANLTISKAVSVLATTVRIRFFVKMRHKKSVQSTT